MCRKLISVHFIKQKTLRQLCICYVSVVPPKLSWILPTEGPIFVILFHRSQFIKHTALDPQHFIFFKTIIIVNAQCSIALLALRWERKLKAAGLISELTSSICGMRKLLAVMLGIVWVGCGLGGFYYLNLKWHYKTKHNTLLLNMKVGRSPQFHWKKWKNWKHTLKGLKSQPSCFLFDF